MSSQIFLSVPFNKKSEAKKLGAWWSQEDKLWFIPDKINEKNKKKLLDEFGKALNEYVYLNVKYDDKDEAKIHGCKWNKEYKKWYIPRDCSKHNYNYLINRFPVSFKSKTKTKTKTKKIIETETIKEENKKMNIFELRKSISNEDFNINLDKYISESSNDEKENNQTEPISKDEFIMD